MKNENKRNSLECIWQEEACFAFSKGKCTCLVDTNFSRGYCPFYKAAQEVDKQYREREL